MVLTRSANFGNRYHCTRSQSSPPKVNGDLTLHLVLHNDANNLHPATQSPENCHPLHEIDRQLGESQPYAGNSADPAGGGSRDRSLD